MNVNNFLLNLQCPITLDLLEDPIIVPCCRNAISREALQMSLESNTRCPLCRGDLDNFDVEAEPKNTILCKLIEDLETVNHEPEVEVTEEHKWFCKIKPLVFANRLTNIAELDISLEKSNFKVNPSLFIAVVDKSGSMAGGPMRQVRDALTHIVNMTYQNPMVTTKIITYDSTSSILNFNSREEGLNHVRNLTGGGGTNFLPAYDKINHVLKNTSGISSVNITFMTDGQPFEDKNTLINSLKNSLSNWDFPITVHCVGFSGGCDKDLLERMRVCGTVEGTFRYADPSDDGDTLCQKLQSLFDITSKSCSIPVTIKLNKNTFFQTGTNEIETKILVNSHNQGQIKEWITLEDTVFNNIECTIVTELDNITLGTDIFYGKSDIQDKWITLCVDKLANDLLELTKNKEESDSFKFKCYLTNQKVNYLLKNKIDHNNREKLCYLRTIIKNLINNEHIDIGVLSEMRFGSVYGVEKIKKKPKQKPTPVMHNAVKKVIKTKSEWKEQPVQQYQRYLITTTPLMRAIVDNEVQTMTDNIKNLIDQSSMEDMQIQDNQYGLTPLMIASYFGQSHTVQYILEKFPKLDINVFNKDNESAVTLAIKRKGYNNAVRILLENGAIIPEDRKDSLREFALGKHYARTAELLANYVNFSTNINRNMPEDSIIFIYKSINKKGLNFDKENFLAVTMSKFMIDIVKDLLEKYKAVPTIDMLLNYCIPPSADYPKTEEYIKLTDLILQHNPDLVFQMDENNTSPLFKAAEKGSLPHVKYFLEKGCDIEASNSLGNTPLWIACAKRYPCIIEELLNNGADVNHLNHKNNPPMYSICQSGPMKIMETLIAFGAGIEYINNNGDTPLLICCRNGKHEILKFLLNFADPEFVNHKAHIDGFNALFASVEADHPECIKVLYNYGIDLNQKTDDNNSIIAGATPLHLAAYYNRIDSLCELLKLGVNPNGLDINGQTALHTAVIQGHYDIIQVLKERCNIGIKDKYGSSAINYCRDEEIKKILIDPVAHYLVLLAKNMLPEDESQKMYQYIDNTSGISGIMNPSEHYNIKFVDGTPLVMYPVLYNNYKLFEILMNMNVDVYASNSYGIRTHFFAEWNNNPRIKKLLENDLHSQETQEHIRNAKNAKERLLLFLGNPPKQTVELNSTLNHRMNQLANISPVSYNENQKLIKDIEFMKFFNTMDIDTNLKNNIIFNAKLMVVNIIASGSTNLSVRELMAITLYTNNSYIYQNLGLNYTYYKTLLDGLQNIEPFNGEVFVGINDIDKSCFKIGNTINISMLSGSTMWRVAVDNVPNYNTGGTVFIIKSKYGRFVGNYSLFCYDSEVIFFNTSFRVIDWYRGGDYIVLGQDNIRHTTYKLSDDEKNNYITNNNSLVIMMEEVE